MTELLNKPDDLRYRRFFNRLHKTMVFDWYMEVGCKNGKSFAGVRGKTIAVDPYFRVAENVIGSKPALLCFQQTSDAFFESNFLEKSGIQLSFSFLDGMHLVEYLLRDFINTEKNSNPKGVIALHDCVPYTIEMTTRNVQDAPADAWTGDVWKFIPILQEYRPDLSISVFGCKPSGLVVIKNLDCNSTVLQDNYDKIIKEWQEISLENYGIDKFNETFSFASCADEINSGFALFADVGLHHSTVAEPEFVSP